MVFWIAPPSSPASPTTLCECPSLEDMLRYLSTVLHKGAYWGHNLPNFPRLFYRRAGVSHHRFDNPRTAGNLFFLLFLFTLRVDF